MHCIRVNYGVLRCSTGLKPINLTLLLVNPKKTSSWFSGFRSPYSEARSSLLLCTGPSNIILVYRYTPVEKETGQYDNISDLCWGTTVRPLYYVYLNYSWNFNNQMLIHLVYVHFKFLRIMPFAVILLIPNVLGFIIGLQIPLKLPMHIKDSFNDGTRMVSKLFSLMKIKCQELTLSPRFKPFV